MPFSLRSFFKKSKSSTFTTGNIPAHIAIVMDGNGRWAAKRGMPRTAGHHAGMVALRRIIRHANEMGIKYLTVYAFSTENWKRPSKEIDYLMRMPNEFLKADLPDLIKKNIRVLMIGSMDRLPPHTQSAVSKAIADTAENTGMVLIFAINYGGRAELTAAVRDIAAGAQRGDLAPESINEDMINRYLYTAGIPDPDLFIRPSGEMRLSNFLLWQLAYSELWFTDVYWPDFDKNHLMAAVEAYGQRDRRYGGIRL